MTDNTDSLLFWLEQEPVDSKENIYLPPDTPTSLPSPKIKSQMNRIQELKKQRTIERLKAVHLEQLGDFRKEFAELVALDQLPNQHGEYLEYIDTDKHLKENLSDILKLVNDIDKIKYDDSILESLAIQDKKTDEQVKNELYIKEQVRVKYSQVLEEQFNNKQNQLISQYYNLLHLIKPSQGRSTIHTQPTIEAANNSLHRGEPH